MVKKLLVVLTLVCAALLYWGWQIHTGQVSLTQVVGQAVPYETALTNGKPTLIEFYADWCETCQAMAKDNYALEQTYGDRLNFVMLNVDNTKWLPELSKYRVDGIPRWIWLNSNQEQVGDGAGLIPKSVMEKNILALIAGEPLPYNSLSGTTSTVSAPLAEH